MPDVIDAVATLVMITTWSVVVLAATFGGARRCARDARTVLTIIRAGRPASKGQPGRDDHDERPA